MRNVAPTRAADGSRAPNGTYTRTAGRTGWRALGFVLVLGVALLIAGCGSSDDATADRVAASGTSSRSVTVDGTTRGYRLYRPAGITGRAALVLVYHGWQQNVQWAERLGWQQAADRHGFVVAFPIDVRDSRKREHFSDVAFAADGRHLAVASCSASRQQVKAPPLPRSVVRVGRHVFPAIGSESSSHQPDGSGVRLHRTSVKVI